jgi:DNA-directed RNA polymerase subunit RPC12/RpoP
MPMLQCKKCYTQIFETNIEQQQGDWIITCSQCGAKNIIAPVLINKVAVKMLYVVGWRE